METKNRNPGKNVSWRCMGWAAGVTGEPSCGRWLVPQLWADLLELDSDCGGGKTLRLNDYKGKYEEELTRLRVRVVKFPVMNVESLRCWVVTYAILDHC